MDRNADKKAGVERLNNFPKATQPTQRLGLGLDGIGLMPVFRSWVPGAQPGQTQPRRQVLACSLPSLGGCRVRHFPILSPAGVSCGALVIQGIGHRSQLPQDYLQCREQSKPAEQAMGWGWWVQQGWERAATPKADRSLQGQKVPQGPHQAGDILSRVCEA